MLNSEEYKASKELQCVENINSGIKVNNGASQDDTKSETKVCSYFSKYGYCKFGKSCRYSHLRKKTENRNNSGQNKVRNATVSRNSFENRVFNANNTYRSRVLKPSNHEASRQICRYYKAGNCSKEECNFLHADVFHDEDTPFSSSVQNRNVSRKLYPTGSHRVKKKFSPLCYFFKKGVCMKGDKCKYFHPNKSTDLKRENSNIPVESTDKNSDACHDVRNTSPGSTNDAVQTVVPDYQEKLTSTSNMCSDEDTYVRIENRDNSFTSLVQDILSNSTGKTVRTKTPTCPEKSTTISNLGSNADISVLRNTEINQMKKRFPNHETVIENKTFSFIFQPSDPDWPFDLRKLKMEVDFPENYPSEKCKLIVHEDNETIPELLIIHLNKAIFEWMENRYEGNKASNKTELIFRPFLKWLDKNLEELFIVGLRKVKMDLKAKEAGIEFVPAENLFSSPRKETFSESSEDTVNRDSCDINPENQIQAPVTSPNTLSNQSTKPFHYSSDQGTKLMFTDLELTEGAAALTCTKISVTLQCSRCRTSFSMKSAPKKSNSHVCSKCSKNIGFTFESSTIHAFSSVLGNLHLLDCVAVDVNLVECHFLVDCLNCSKQAPVDGIHYGQKHKMWCTFCHEKMLINIGSVKCQAFKLASVPTMKYLPAKKTDKKVKDPVVKEGEPLPNFGACKHYKKSFRWLRFPCCGRLYPCDECHNEKETDHEMKYASRMICGFCAKEQPYSKEKPCLLCLQSLTRKSGAHWEGGKGCRNKISMSRDDKQKYAGVSKTVSKRAQSQNTKSKKK